MSQVVLHDSGRPGKLTWAVAAIRDGLAAGMVLSPFETPPVTVPRRPSAQDCVTAITAVGGRVFLDPMTHGCFLPAANQFAYYDAWDWWPNNVRQQDRAVLRDHVARAITSQLGLGLTPISPTLLLESPLRPEADLARDMAARSVEIEGSVHLAIAGSPRFWAAGLDLDAFVGDLARLRPGGWIVTVVRDRVQYPPAMDAADVFGLCRTVHGLSLRGAPVFVGHGDLVALPTVVAGAEYVGSGWDLRNRVATPDLFRRETAFRRQSQRVTHQGLIASLRLQEGERVRAADAALSARLLPGSPIPPDFPSRWRHDITCLRDLIEDVRAAGDRPARANRLRQLYLAAVQDFDDVRALGPLEAGRQAWLDAVIEGLALYAAEEGW